MRVRTTNWAESWGITVGDDTAYSVNGRGDDYEWTAVHALDAATGRNRWSFQRERRLAVEGRFDDALVAAVGSKKADTSLVGLSRDGEVEWRVPLRKRGLLPHGDRVYVADDAVAAVTADDTVACQTPSTSASAAANSARSVLRSEFAG